MDQQRRRVLGGVTLGALTCASQAAAAPPPAPAAPSGQIRRVVSGHDAAGRSIIVMDGPAPHTYRRTAESVAITELWGTDSAPADNDAPGDPTDKPLRLEPPENGSAFRILEFMPDRQQRSALEKQLAEGDDGSGIVTALKKGAAGRAPGFHKTDTIDYVIVLSGTIYALLDEGEVRLEQGDVFIQRGTNHAWSNRSDSVARLAFVLIDAKSHGGA